MTPEEFNRMMLPECPARGEIIWARVVARVVGLLILVLFWGGVAYGVANASVLNMHFEQHGAHVSTKQLRQLREANIAYSGLVHRYWGSPIVQFHAGQGIPIIITGQAGMEGYCGLNAVACHGLDNYGRPVIVVAKYDGNWTMSVSHEVAETVVDPNVDRIIGPRYVEVCDAVENAYFTYRGNPSLMSDFVTPAWFNATAGPWDVGRLLNHAAPWLLSGGYDPLTGNRASVSRSRLLKRLAT